MSKPVVTIGECLIDLIAPKGSDLLDSPSLAIREGGAPANVAVGLARLGVPVQMRTVLGDDPFGQRLYSRLEREGIDVSRVRFAEHEPTTIALAWADADGDGHFRIHRHADRLLSAQDVEIDDIEAVVFGSVSLCAQPSADTVVTAVQNAAARDIPLVFDVNIRPGMIPMDDLRMLVTVGLAASTVVKLSLDDAAHLWGCTTLAEAADALDRFDPPVVVITDGSRGAMLRIGDTRIVQDVFPVDAVEPTGAGDAFTSAFVSRMIARGWQGADGDDLRFAMASGALATTLPGAMDGLPTRAQVLEFLDAHTP
ncbi:MAG: carbohydrate kinase [Thermomicrobiales bacterium]|nr:carbohydrate kinase [Thermomicrobiales bacterium]